jgi:hypothetical protein
VEKWRGCQATSNAQAEETNREARELLDMCGIDRHNDERTSVRRTGGRADAACKVVFAQVQFQETLNLT